MRAISYFVQCTTSYLVSCNALITNASFYSRLLYSKEAVLCGSKGLFYSCVVISVSLFGMFTVITRGHQCDAEVTTEDKKPFNFCMRATSTSSVAMVSNAELLYNRVVLAKFWTAASRPYPHLMHAWHNCLRTTESFFRAAWFLLLE